MITLKNKSIKLIRTKRKINWIVYTLDIEGHKRPLKANLYSLTETFSAFKNFLGIV